MPISHALQTTTQTIVGEPVLRQAQQPVEYVDARRAGDAGTVETSAAWLRLKDAATALQPLQTQDGSIPETADHAEARPLVEVIMASIRDLAPLFPHDADYLAASIDDFARWID